LQRFLPELKRRIRIVKIGSPGEIRTPVSGSRARNA
jgi:hypothetical protein